MSGGKELQPSFVTPEMVKQLQEERERRAQAFAEIGVSLRSQPLTRERKDYFLRLVAAGVPMTRAAELVQVDYQTILRERRKNPHFAEDIQVARDLSVEEVEARLEQIALHGHENNMATVKAAELILKRSRAYNDRNWQSSKAEATAPDGSKFSVTVGTPGPD